jgi:hypothetical protein
VIERASVSLITRTVGAHRPLRQDRHFSEASSFQPLSYLFPGGEMGVHGMQVVQHS